MIERFNDSNKIVTNRDLIGDDRILTDILFTYPESVKAIHSSDLVQNVKNAYNTDDNVDKQKLLMGTEISVAVPRIVKIQCTMMRNFDTAKYTHARAVNARLHITWPNGDIETLPIPDTWVQGYLDGLVTTYFDFLTTAALCDGCQVKITKGILGVPAYVELATDANGTGATRPTTYAVTSELQTISSNMNEISLFRASMSSGDIVITPKRQITVELRSTATAYYSVEITTPPSWNAGSQDGTISFGSSYSNVGDGQLLSTYTINLDDGNYNIFFGSLRATTKVSPYVSESNILIYPSPGNITITEGETTTYKVIYDLGSIILD